MAGFFLSKSSNESVFHVCFVFTHRTMPICMILLPPGVTRCYQLCCLPHPPPSFRPLVQDFVALYRFAVTNFHLLCKKLNFPGYLTRPTSELSVATASKNCNSLATTFLDFFGIFHRAHFKWQAWKTNAYIYAQIG